ncbi:gliding motility-associated C-terminal domain-containing protein [Cesiribacter sp. SM1]|uniref:gliding motility-associated C-terminal domain-containing protein n=1 Tax=Cesiribacter sp. SM1 TaxID=2861196 RepID=UPI001CD605BF|nr:gliding motility-associated C-terminal domain-containing protein [Cesiribacter sp. SM1]
MQKILLILAVVLGGLATTGSLECYGQARINNLIFNSTDQIIGLDFSNPAAAEVFYTGKRANATIGEGIAHAENEQGEIIFWVNASGVYDKNNNLMPGSSGIFAHPSSTEIVIAPFPNHPSRYYIFYNNQLCSSLYYSVVDMALRNGQGDVVSLNTIITPGENFAEGLEVVRIPCSRNYWLLANECGKGLTRFRIDEAGISAGELFLANSLNTGGRGELDYHGGKLGYAITFSNQCLVADFDPESGVATNLRNISIPARNGTYGLEFSPDAGKVWVTDLSNRDIFGNLTGNNLFSYDLSTGITKAWSISNTNTGCSGQMEGLGQIELGKDGRLYITQIEGCQVIVVDNPGSDNPTISKIDVSSRLSAGISDHIQSDFLDENLLINPQISPEGPLVLCENESVLLSYDGAADGKEFQWFHNGNPVASASSSTLQVQQTGSYSLQLSNRAGCVSTTNSVTVTDMSIPELPFQRVYDVCESIPLVLDTHADDYIISWSNGTQGPSTSVKESGSYTVTFSNGHCSRTDTVQVLIRQKTAYKIPNVIVPNGDQWNEFFEIRELQGSISLQIYNRWGKLVYAAADYKNNWQGQGLMQGTYYYKIRPLTACGVEQTGWILVMNGVATEK